MPTLVNSIQRKLRLTLALAVVLTAAACIEWDRSTSHETIDIRQYVSGVQAPDGKLATLGTGTAPVAGTGAALTAVMPALVLKGGAVSVTFTSPTPFSRVVLYVNGVAGYWDLNLAASVTSVDLLIVYAQQVGAPSFTLAYAGGTPAGVGSYQSGTTAFLGNGTGEVQVNISWDSRADVDLYVVDPLGEEIYYAHRGSASGGQLDIDSNAACGTDGPRAENIFWPFGVVPPHGNYLVRANYWSACGETETNYVVTIRTKDGTAHSYRGKFTGPGVGGAAGAGGRVTDFDY